MEYLIKNPFFATETILFIWVIENMSYHKKNIAENIQPLLYLIGLLTDLESLISDHADLKK